MQMYNMHQVEDDRGRVGRVGAWDGSGPPAESNRHSAPPDLALVEPLA